MAEAGSCRSQESFLRSDGDLDEEGGCESGDFCDRKGRDEREGEMLSKALSD